MNDDQLLRYSRHIMLPELDIAGQEALLSASVLIVGLGGLGAPASLYLAAAGVGHLVLADHDVVDLSNLQRQIVHHTSTLGQTKVASARATLTDINPDIHIDTISDRLAGDALIRAVAGVDLVLDASDNFSVRYELNEACFEQSVPLVSGAAIRWEGQVAVFDPRDPTSPCYRCLYAEGDDEALNCSESGVAAPLVGVIGSTQALEALKLLTGAGESLVGHVLYLDARRMEWRRLRLPKAPDCPTCSG